MKTCTLKSVYEQIVRLQGLDPDTVAHTAAQVAKLAELINGRTRTGWEFDWWPELMVIEQRQYRETWDASHNYSTDEEVYYDGAYYVSLQDNNSGYLPDETDSTWWEAVGDDFIKSINFEQEDEDEIGGADPEECIYDQNPLVYAGTPPILPVILYQNQIIVQAGNAPLLPWVKFRPPVPTFSLTAWSNATAYAVGDLCYLATYNTETVGQTFKAITAGTNKNPYTQTDYWTEEPFPDFLRNYVARGVELDTRQEDEGRPRDETSVDKLLEDLVDARIGAQAMRATRRAVYKGA